MITNPIGFNKNVLKIESGDKKLGIRFNGVNANNGTKPAKICSGSVNGIKAGIIILTINNAICTRIGDAKANSKPNPGMLIAPITYIVAKYHK